MASTTVLNLNFFLSSEAEMSQHFDHLARLSLRKIEQQLSQYGTDNRSSENGVIIAVDEVIRFYGRIFIGSLAGVFPKNLNKTLVDDMHRFLDTTAIRRYYMFSKPFFLADAMLSYCSAIKQGNADQFYPRSEDADDYFSLFLIVTKSIVREKSIRDFFAFFESNDGERKNYMQKRTDLLKHPQEINRIFNDKIGGPDINVGAILFCDKIDELIHLLDHLSHLPLLQSAMWHYASGYFSPHEATLRSYYRNVFQNLESAFVQSEMALELGSEDVLFLKAQTVLAESRQKMNHILSGKTGYNNALSQAVANYMEATGEKVLA